MCVKRGEERCANAVMAVLLVRDMSACARVPEFLRKAEVDDIDEVSGMAGAHDEVRWFNVSVYEVASMDELDAGNLE